MYITYLRNIQKTKELLAIKNIVAKKPHKHQGIKLKIFLNIDTENHKVTEYVTEKKPETKP